MALLYDYKKRRQVKKEAKVEAGKKGKKGKKIDEKYQKEGSKGKKNYQATKLGTFLRKNFTKSKTGVKPIGSGGGQDIKRKTSPKYPKKINQEAVDIGISKNIGKRSINGESKEVARYDSSSTTKKGIEAKKKEGEKETGTNFKGSATTKGGDRVLDKNKAKIAKYVKDKASVKEEKDKEKYVSGSRTATMLNKKASINQARNRFEKDYGEGSSKRKLYRVLKKKGIDEMKKRRKKSPLAKF